MRSHTYVGLFESMLAHGCRFKTLFSPPKPKLDFSKPAPLPTPADPSVAQRRKDERLSLKRRRGRASTILTSPLGDVSDEEKAATLGQTSAA